MTTYEKTSFGFLIRIPLNLYARPAVIKALYSYRDKYLISYELTDQDLIIYFEPVKDISFELKEEVSNILKDLDFQMIRYDTMNGTKEIRELLVARALYTTCIEPEHEELDTVVEDNVSSWKNDIQGIFSSWASEKI